jgi:hypothetical protein
MATSPPAGKDIPPRSTAGGGYAQPTGSTQRQGTCGRLVSPSTPGLNCCFSSEDKIPAEFDFCQRKRVKGKIKFFREFTN